MFRRMLLDSALVLVALVVLPAVVLPQAFDLNKSTGAPGTIYHGSAIDDVNLSSGNLRISIPLLDLPGRGLNTSIYLTYNSKVWNTQVYDDPFGYTSAFADFDADTLQRPTYGWGLGVPRMYQKPGNFWTYCVLPSGSGCGAAYFYYTYVMADGTRNSVVNEGLPISPSNPTPPGYWSFDGSYVRANATGIHYKDGAVTRNTGGVAQLPGQTHYDVTLRDTNGNYIRCIPASCTDTLGRVINFNYAGNLIQSMTYLDSSGATQSVIFTYETKTFYYPWVVDFFHQSCWDFPCGFSRRLTASVLKRVTLPNNLFYEFEHFINSDGSTTGEITKIKLPTGGYIRYTYDWATAYRIDGQSGPEYAQQRAVKTRTVSSDGTPASEQTWTYVVQNADCSTQAPNAISTVTDPLGNIQAQTQFAGTPMPTKIEYKDPTGVVLRTVNQTIGFDASSYNDPGFNNLCTVNKPSNPRALSETTILNDSGQTSSVQYEYGSHGNITTKREYDFGGALVRRIVYSYLHNTSLYYANPNVHILYRKLSESIYTPSSQLKAQTLYEYDNTGITSTSSTPSPQHDYASHPSTFATRGNLTKVKRWRNTDGAWLTTTNTYNDLGNLLQTTDPDGHTTTFSYADNFTDGINRNSRAFVTQTSLPATGGVNHIERSQYFFNSGLLAASCGENFPAASACANTYIPPQPDYAKYSYDGVNRLLSATSADGGQTTLAYNEASLPITVTSTTKIDAAQNLVETAIYDGLGRTKQTQQNSNPLCTVKVDVTYDEIGRQKTVTNPYCTPSDPTYGITTYNYDGLGRVTSVVSPSGGSVVTTYSGSETTITDQQGKAQRGRADALGRLIQVDEPNPTLATPAVTTYTYDALDNLTQVVQSGSRQRTFTYNSLSQLLTASNPESGAITYTYDNDGNLITKTDARGIATTHSYDALHRLTQKSYSDGTPLQTLMYDTGSGYQINMAGRLSRSCWEGTYVNCDWFGYDPVGRVTRHEQGGGLWPSTLYTYNLAGNVTDLGYYEYYTGKPTRWIRYSYDTAGRVNRVEETSPQPKIHAESILYHPHGAWSSMTLSNGALQQSAAYNNRLQPTSKVLSDVSPASTIMNFTYNFVDSGGKNNGNVVSMWDNVQVLNYGFQYDELNRLTRAETTNSSLWGNAYVYDPWGNLYQKNQIAGKQQGEFFQQTMNAQNQFVGWSYDAAGNQLNDGAHNYQYDPEGRIKCMDAGANCTSPAASYTYSIEGRRVRRTANGATTLYLHDSGSVLSEFTNPSQGVGTWQKDYIYLNGALLATESATDGTRYHFSDHLGTPRVVTDAAGNVISRHDYYPYGKEITTWSDGETHKFTGKERDPESNLDYFIARYYAPSAGRFTSPDPDNAGATETDPQSWNAYSYARNNPLANLDPTGRKYCRAVFDDDGNVIEITEECVEDEDYSPKSHPDYVRVSVDEKVFVTPEEEQTELPWWDIPGQAFVTVGDCALNGNAWQCGEWVAGAVPVGKAAVFLFGRFGGVLTKLNIPGASKFLNSKGLAYVNALENHHLLPKKHIGDFAKAGLDINSPELMLDMRRYAHRLRSGPGIETNANPVGQTWGKVWDEFFERNSNPSKEQILEKLAAMRKEFGI